MPGGRRLDLFLCCRSSALDSLYTAVYTVWLVPVVRIVAVALLMLGISKSESLIVYYFVSKTISANRERVPQYTAFIIESLITIFSQEFLFSRYALYTHITE